MNIFDWAPLIGTAATVIGTIVAIIAALNARNFSRRSEDSAATAKKAMVNIQQAAVVERLKSAQQHIRDIAPEKISQRGFDATKAIDRIRIEFDHAMNALSDQGTAGEARKLISTAQKELNNYNPALSKGPNEQTSEEKHTTWHDMQSRLQDAISKLSSELLN